MESKEHAYNLVENSTGKVVGKVKLKKTLKEYATGAVVALESQLETVRSPIRKAKLLSRIDDWNRILEITIQDEQENLKKLEELKNETQDTVPQTETQT